MAEESTRWFGFNTLVPQAKDPKNETGTFALHTLAENETIAKLATGIKRFESARRPELYQAVPASRFA